jgi:hypothetical protein
MSNVVTDEGDTPNDDATKPICSGYVIGVVREVNADQMRLINANAILRQRNESGVKKQTVWLVPICLITLLASSSWTSEENGNVLDSLSAFGTEFGQVDLFVFLFVQLFSGAT